MRTYSGLSLVAVTAVALLSACSSSDGGRAAETMAGTSRLEAAMTHVADDDAARSRFAFADTMRIRDLYSAENKDNMITLLGKLVAGAEFDNPSGGPDQLGVTIGSSDFVISVGDTETGHTGLIGGQDQKKIVGLAEDAGWVEDDGEWLALPYGEAVAASANQAATQRFNGAFPRIVPTGENVAIGRAASDLTLPGVSFVGMTLADNDRAAALANCLGDVIAANIRTDVVTDGGAMVGIAAGISTPTDSRDLTAHHVVCVMWADEDAATAYEDAIELDVENRWDKVALSDSVIERLDVSDVTVRWEIDARTRSAVLGLETLDGKRSSLPGIPSCRDDELDSGRYPYGCLPVVPVTVE